MPITVIAGVNWGDEGKGRMVDLLAEDAEYVVRFHGGNNAGHTVVNEQGVFKLHLMPSGIFRPDVQNVLGPGIVVDLEGLMTEIIELRERGIATDQLVVSNRATVCLPVHRMEDIWEEERLSSQSFGSTKRGIAPAYADRYLKKAIQLGELADTDHLRRRVRDLIEWKNLVALGVHGRRDAFDVDEVMDWLLYWGQQVLPFICDTSDILQDAVDRDANILLEGQLGALKDVFFGTYPYTSSSLVLASAATTAAGMFGCTPDTVVGVMKAYSTAVGEGPLVTEMPEDEAASLRETAMEYGATTGRPRRIGHFDGFASAYGARIHGVTSLALTKLDSLSGRPTLPVCTGYTSGGVNLKSFPLSHELATVVPEYEVLEGWSEDITGVREFSDLPPAAQRYVLFIETMIGRPIEWISVGPHRDAFIHRPRP